MIRYHFLQADMTSGQGTEGSWVIGETRTLPGTIVPCEYGYHASPTPFDALQYAPGPVLCAVTLDGEIPDGDPVDKFAGNTRTLLAAVNIERELRLFAADCAEHVLKFFEAACPDDQTPRMAIQGARDFANGLIDREQLAAAGRAAKSAAPAGPATPAAGTGATWALWASVWAAAYTACAAAVGAPAAARDAARDAWDAWASEEQWQRDTFNALCIAWLTKGLNHDES